MLAEIGSALLDFYPRPPRGGRRIRLPRGVGRIPISIHALREEGDSQILASKQSSKRFLSTPSARRATCFSTTIGHDFAISIHALREEGDRSAGTSSAAHCTISIHALREEGDAPLPRQPAGANLFLSTPSARRATYTTLDGTWTDEFLSTPSARRATARDVQVAVLQRFLSTPSARRATAMDPAQSESLPYFYPRPPRGGRRRHLRRVIVGADISIHALREEGDMYTRVFVHVNINFYPRPPRGGRRQ